jgi:site-specific DNA-methyltransferase (adenine-specific)
MMAIRIYYMRELLKDTGSFYLHCDPTMSHFLKIICDLIFFNTNFRNEIVWCYKWGGSSSKRYFKKKHDVIFRYSKSNNFIFNEILMYGDKSGWSDDTRGRLANDWWVDIPSLNTQAKEKLGYPTQKPKTLLDRILQASSNEGDTIADFFCGCGTTVDSAVSLKRNFIGVDISTLSVSLMEKRLKDRHSFTEGKQYKTHGLPVNIEQAQKLADSDKFEFQNWVVAYLVKGIPNPKKTGDGGIDGQFYYKLPTQEKNNLCLLEVKGGKNLSISQVRAFIKVCQENKDNAGLLLTMGNITDGMKRECYMLGNIDSNIPKCNIVSIQDIMEGRKPEILSYNITNTKAQRNIENLF